MFDAQLAAARKASGTLWGGWGRERFLPLVFCLLVGLPGWGQNPNVTVDDQPTAEQRLAEVGELRRAGRYAQAAELVQELVETGRFKLVPVGEGAYADVGHWAVQSLWRDGELRRAYVERYSAAAERALMQAQAQPTDERLSGLLGVYRRYRATVSGLAAGLDAAGLLLASGQASSAGTVLDELDGHPELAAVQVRYLVLRGAVATYTQDMARFAEIVDELAEVDAAAAGRLRDLAQSVEAAAVVGRASQVDMGAKPVSLREPLWEQVLVTADNKPGWQLEDRSVVPVVTAGRVLLNNGRQVVALDRASGRRAWAYPGDDDSSVTKSTLGQRWQGARAVARDRGRVVGVLGEMYGISQRQNPFVPPNDLVCVDEQTGRLLWQRVAGVFEAGEPREAADRRAGRVNLQHTHFVGTPTISHGKVFVVTRRANSQGSTQSNWLMAYDAADGSLLWYRHLALVTLSLTSADALRVSPGLSVYGDTLYFNDQLGAVGAVDVHTGDYRWLRVLPVGTLTTKSITANTRGIGSEPVLTSAGLVVPLSISSDRLMLVDPGDGAVLRSFRGDPVLGKTQYILEAGDGVLSVGRLSASYWDAEQGVVRWTRALADGEVMRGRGAVSLRFAVLPTSRRMLVVDLATGEVVDESAGLQGSVVLRDGEVIAVGGGRARAYTSWDRVYARLVGQLERGPTDPAPGLSLAYSAVGQPGQGTSVLQGVEHAISAVSRQPMNRRMAVAELVFEQLRGLIPEVDEPVLRGALYERLALVTQSARQSAGYHLDAGLYFASRGEAARAVEHLHAVIAEPAFASAVYEADGVDRLAGRVAQQALGGLIERFGRGVYARQDALAQAWVDELRAAGRLDAVALAAVAKRYPLSPLTGRLLLDAARGHESAGRLIAAAGLYKQALQGAVDDAQRQAAAGHLIGFYLNTGRPGLAGECLDRFVQAHPGLLPTVAGQPLSLADWRERIASVPVPRTDRLELAGGYGVPVLIDGQLVGTLAGHAVGDDRGRVYVRQGDTLSCRLHTDPTEPIWSVGLGQVAGPLLRIAEEGGQVLFFAPAAGRVLAFDSTTGEVLWGSAVGFADASGGIAGRVPQGVPTAGDEGQVLVAVSETVVCFGHRETAEVIAIDRATGYQIWRTRLDMAVLTAMHADNWSLAVAGRAGYALQRRSGKVAVLNLADARPLLGSPLQQVTLTPLGVAVEGRRVVVLGVTGALALEVPTGRTGWVYRLPEPVGRMLNQDRRVFTGVFAIQGQRLAAEVNDGAVHLLDLSNQGRLIDDIAVRTADDPRTTELLAGGGGALWCVSAGGVFRFDELGDRTWHARIPTPDASARALVYAPGHAVLLVQPEPDPQGQAQQANDQHHRLSLTVLQTDGGRAIDEYEIAPLPAGPDLEGATQFGHGLAIPVGDQTLIVPGA